MNSDYCGGCIRKQICYLPNELNEYDERVGWCGKCNKCPECKEKYAFRIKWIVCGGTNLYRDVCDKHSEPKFTPGSDCSCSHSPKNITKIPYVYL